MLRRVFSFVLMAALRSVAGLLRLVLLPVLAILLAASVGAALSGDTVPALLLALAFVLLREARYRLLFIDLISMRRADAIPVSRTNSMRFINSRNNRVLRGAVRSRRPAYRNIARHVSHA
jgi:hypothetical protein